MKCLNNLLQAGTYFLVGMDGRTVMYLDIYQLIRGILPGKPRTLGARGVPRILGPFQKPSPNTHVLAAKCRVQKKRAGSR